MDRKTLLLSLAQRLAGAIDQRDWEGLRRIDAEIARALPSILAAAPLNAGERHAAQSLSAMHQRGLQRCTEVLTELDSRMREMRANREGWMAYAQVAEGDVGA
jgi:ribosome biogenesis protein Tsr3